MNGDMLFVTGAQRSGTTLLEKLIGAQDGVTMLSQPFPLLFVEAKRAFLESIGIHGERYPLGHLFRETRYSRHSLAEFLGRWRPARSELQTLFEQMRDYSGQYTKFEARQLDRALDEVETANDFAATVCVLARSLAHDPAANVFGLKETICEELLPYFLDRGHRCAIILRDPRDIAASLNHGRGADFAGSIKPTLTNVRNWRKSVAFALALEGREGFRWCRYEDLVADPAGVLAAIGDGLAIANVRLSGSIRDAAGNEWSGNSSHGALRGISAASIGIHRNALPETVARMIEATCLPELQLLGYETTLTRADAAEIIVDFQEPYVITRQGMDHDFATPENAAAEIARLERLVTASAGDAGEWFLFAEVRERLRETFC